MRRRVKLFPKKWEDWCHLCGQRTDKLVGFDVPHNAEDNIIKPSRYVRLCKDCINEIKNKVDEI